MIRFASRWNSDLFIHRPQLNSIYGEFPPESKQEESASSNGLNALETTARFFASLILSPTPVITTGTLDGFVNVISVERS